MGERLLDVRERARSLIDDMGSTQYGNHIVVVSHGTFLRVLLAHLLNIKLHELTDIRLDNASVSIFQYDSDTGGAVHSMNYTKHLEELL